MIIHLNELEDLTKRAVLKYGYTRKEAETICAVLLYAQLRGNNQGVVKLVGPGIPKSSSAGEILMAKEDSSFALVDGNSNHAMLVMDFATELAKRKAMSTGIGVVGAFGISTSSGAIGYYARKLAESDLVGIVFAGATPVVAPEGSSQPVFGTNPLAIGVPSENGSVVLDMATAAMPFFGLIEAQLAGRLLPEGFAYDAEGNDTVDPSVALQGALRTFDRGRKGSGISFMIQALTGPLVGSSFVGIGDIDHNWGGHLIIGIDPDRLAGVASLKDGVGRMVEVVNTAKRHSAIIEVLAPGQRGDRLAASVLASGEIDIGDELYSQLLAVASE